MNDIILTYSDGTTTELAFRFLREEDGVRIYQNILGVEKTLEEITRLAESAGLIMTPIGRVGTMDFLTWLANVKKYTLASRGTTYPGLVEEAYKSWNRMIATGPRNTHGALAPLTGPMSEWLKGRLITDVRTARREAVDLTEARPPSITEFIDRFATGKWDLLDPNTQRDHFQQMVSAVAAYVQEHDPDFADEHEDVRTALALAPYSDIMAALSAMSVGDDYLQYIEDSPEPIKAIVTGLAGNVERMGALAQEEQVSTDRANQETILGNVNTILKNFQATYGATEGTKKFQDYTKRYMEELPFVKPITLTTPTGDVFQVPDLLLTDDVKRFNEWVDIQEEAESAAVPDNRAKAEARARSSRQGRNISFIRQQFVDAFGNAELANITMEEAIRFGNDLSSAARLGEFMRTSSPAQVKAKWIPSSVEEVYIALGLDTNQLMAGIGRDTELGRFQTFTLTQALQQGQNVLNQGALAPETQEGVINTLNNIIATLPLPSTEGFQVTQPGEQRPLPTGQRQFFLSRGVAEADIFQPFLLGNLPLREAETARSFFPQIWERFPGKAQRGGRETFQKHLESLGSTFFARLTPKQERVSGPRVSRQPGGGRPTIG